MDGRRILLIILLLFSLGHAGSAQQVGQKSISQLSPGFLENTRWRITVVPDEVAAKTGAKEFSDTVEFKDGKFSSTAFSAKGFKPVTYRGDFEEKEAEFEATQTSESEGAIIWLGEIKGDRVIGSLQWKKKDGANLLVNFSGTKK